MKKPIIQLQFDSWSELEEFADWMDVSYPDPLADQDELVETLNDSGWCGLETEKEPTGVRYAVIYPDGPEIYSNNFRCQKGFDSYDSARIYGECQMPGDCGEEWEKFIEVFQYKI